MVLLSVFLTLVHSVPALDQKFSCVSILPQLHAIFIHIPYIVYEFYQMQFLDVSCSNVVYRQWHLKQLGLEVCEPSAST